MDFLLPDYSQVINIMDASGITFITHAQRKKMETEKGVIKVALRWMYGRVCEYVCVCFEW
jgi:hypothetical protein